MELNKDTCKADVYSVFEYDIKNSIFLFVSSLIQQGRTYFFLLIFFLETWKSIFTLFPHRLEKKNTLEKISVTEYTPLFCASKCISFHQVWGQHVPKKYWVSDQFFFFLADKKNTFDWHQILFTFRVWWLQRAGTFWGKLMGRHTFSFICYFSNYFSCLLFLLYKVHPKIIDVKIGLC